ncbi:MAG TPA: SurA N-terminal domain-containing protein [Gemmatimonadales bacterium]|jgi:peptidyl-prolyl cis-trans isomerase D
MLSTMREKTKIVMVVLAVAFVGWLVFDVGMGVTGRSNTNSRDIGSVNGTPIRYQAYMNAYQAAYDNARQQNPGATFSREEQREIENNAFNQMVQAELLNEEYRRHGIVVTDKEIIDAVRRAPPPEITQSPDFQTNGQFDPAKYDRFLGSSNANTRQYLLAMEARYREELPRYKLFQEVTSDVYVSDAKLWTIWRDTHDSLVVRMMIFRPRSMPASQSVPSDTAVQHYYDSHKDEFRLPARAKLSFIAVSKLPSPLDSVALVNHARAIRDSILHGADFAAVARTESADTVSARNGGSLGTFGKGKMDPAFERAAFATPVGAISEPVFSSFGIHLIKVEKRTADSVTARHILFPYGRIGARLDTLEAQADSLDHQAADQTDPAALDSAAHRMHLSVEHPPTIYKGVPYVLGRYRIPDVGVWAFEAHPGETSPVIEVQGGYYVFRLDSSFAAGVPPLADLKPAVMIAVQRQMQRAAAEAMAHDAEHRLNAGKTMEQVAAEMPGSQTITLGPLPRIGTWPELGVATAAVGEAFRLRIGERSPLLSNDDGFFFLQPERRINADSATWARQKDAQRAEIIRAARQIRVQNYVESLQRSAKIKDRRAEVLRPTTQAATK